MRALTVIATVLFSLIGVVSASADRGSSLRWGDCPDLGLPTPGLQCATLDVPLDYRNPHAGTIEVAVSRLPSTNPAKRRGVMLMNPGGPGGPGLAMPIGLVNAGVSASVRESYDLIGFDPRGIELSTPVSCGLPPEFQVSNVPPYARTSAEVVDRAGVARQIAGLCGSGPTADILPFMNTANTARDMDRIRMALGERTISYYGVSYGSYLGAVYSTLFPRRTDRIVLDSLTGLHGLDVETSRRFGLGFQERFPDFAAWAAERDSTYGLGATPRTVTAKYFELAGKLDQAPVAGVDGPLFRLFTFSRLYFDENFADLAGIWQQLNTVAVTALPDIENIVSAQLSVVCNDNDWPESVRTYQRNVEVDRIRYPMFGAAAANIWPCAFWPTDPVERPVRITDQGPSNILLINNLRDPATPLVGAREMRDALGQRARFVTVDAGGHGAWLLGSNSCANRTVNEFLVDGARPASDTMCAKESVGPTGSQRDSSWLRSAVRF
jgi:pimeloyl-ACP methyl ester carboxylesterase